MRAVAPLLIGCVLTAACGSRTGLLAPDEPAGPDATVDSSMDGGDASDAAAQPDVVVVTDAGCQRDDQCQQGVACVLDRCDTVLHVCTRTPRDTLCADGLYCDGAERCDLTLGCQKGAPPSCDDGISCTVDSCDEGQKACAHAPHDELCPISHICDLALGCQAHAFAHDNTTLYDVRLPSGAVNTLGPIGASLTDVALAPTNVLYGIDFNTLFTLNQQSGLATPYKAINSGFLNGADVAPDGTLYVAGGISLFKVDLTTGTATLVTNFPPGLTSSGDLAFVGNRLLATATVNAADSLVEFNLATKTSKSLGVTGFGCIWGLAAYGQTLYGLTCDGRVLSIDPNTAASKQLNQVNKSFRGASAR